MAILRSGGVLRAQQVFHERVFLEYGKIMFSQKHFPESIFPKKNPLG